MQHLTCKRSRVRPYILLVSISFFYELHVCWKEAATLKSPSCFILYCMLAWCEPKSQGCNVIGLLQCHTWNVSKYFIAGKRFGSKTSQYPRVILGSSVRLSVWRHSSIKQKISLSLIEAGLFDPWNCLLSADEILRSLMIRKCSLIQSGRKRRATDFKIACLWRCSPNLRGYSCYGNVYVCATSHFSILALHYSFRPPQLCVGLVGWGVCC